LYAKEHLKSIDAKEILTELRFPMGSYEKCRGKIPALLALTDMMQT
jgi:hypothetical protein